MGETKVAVNSPVNGPVNGPAYGPGDGDARDPAVDLLAPPSERAGTAPGIELQELTQRPSTGGVRVRCIDYCPEQSQVLDVTDLADFLGHHRPAWSRVRWIDVQGLGDMVVIHALAQKYELHPLAIEDVLTRQRPKADDYPAADGHPSRLFVVARKPRLLGSRLVIDQISLFLGRNTLVTFQPFEGDVFDEIRRRLATPGSRIRQNDVSFLLYSLLDAVVDTLFPILERYSNRLEKLERRVLSEPTRETLSRIHRTKHDLVALRRIVWPMREMILYLHREVHPCLSDTTRTYFRDLYDHIVMAGDFLETYREFVASQTEMYMSSISNRMNDIMKTLTIISTIFVPLTFLAGVYGMNMPIPENASPWMYPLFWVVSLGVGAGMLYWFRRRGWF